MDNINLSDPGLKGALHPALRPNNVHAVMKEKYQIPAKGRMLFRDMVEPLDEYRDILDKAIAGDVGEISGGAGFEFVDSQFESVVGVINGFGGAFKMTFEEMKWSRISLVEKKMRDLLYKMRKYYEIKALTALRDATGVGTFDGSNWGDTVNGDPFVDLEKAKGIVSDNHGAGANLLVLNRSMYLKLMKFKEYREFRLLGYSNYEKYDVEMALTPNGLKMMVFDDSLNAYIQDNIVYVLRQGDAGVNHSAIPFTSFDTPDPESPLGRVFYAHEWTTPSVDKRDALAICKITGLNA